MLKVSILTEGGRDIGIGHLTRCISLCQAFEERGIKPEFIVNGDDTVRALLKGRRYQIFNWIEREDKLFKIIKGASVLIVDSYLVDAGFYEEFSEAVEIPVYIDDNRRVDYPKGIVVNGTIYAKDLGYLKKEDTEYLLGIEYIPLRKEFWSVCQKEIKDKVENIMVTFGGDDLAGLTPKILSFLNEAYPEYRKYIIIGNAFQNKNIKKIENLKNERTKMIYNPNVEEMKEIMLESDLAISAGGQTLYELARTGVPTIGVCVADNQEHNLQGWREKGFIEYAGWYNGENLFQKISEILKMLNYEKRKMMNLTGRRFVDGQGAKRIVEEILTKYADLEKKYAER